MAPFFDRHESNIPHIVSDIKSLSSSYSFSFVYVLPGGTSIWQSALQGNVVRDRLSKVCFGFYSRSLAGHLILGRTMGMG